MISGWLNNRNFIKEEHLETLASNCKVAKEELLLNVLIPLNTYDSLVSNFNPSGFNADEWVKLAKSAGMRYIVVTSKHHDGFCMFDTKETDYAIMSTHLKGIF